jgi:CHAT domain-containing protein
MSTMGPRTIVFDPEKVDEFRALGRLPDLEREERYRQGYAAAKRTMEAALERIRKIPGFERFEKDPTFADLARAVTTDWPIAFLITTAKGSLALILSRTAAKADVAVEAVWMDAFDVRRLGALLVETDGGELVGGFVHAQIHPERMESVLPDTLSGLGQDLMLPLVTRLQALGFSRVVLIPGGYLGLLPLHAARISAADAAPLYVIDAIDVTYALSGRAAFAARQELDARGSRADYLCGVGNPQPSPAPLRFGVDELREVAELFPEGSKTALFERDATVGNVARALPQGTHIHFACHCRPDWSSPMHSELELGDEPLAVWEIQYNFGDALSKARLVVLSACQSGMRETTLPDEAIGLPSAFLQAGVPAVIATLWPVDDLSSALLMTRFYELLLRGNPATGEPAMNPVRALCRAQGWLRDISVRELQDYVRRREMSQALIADVDERFGAENPALRPFAESPFDWAPFVAFGV